MKIAVFLQLKRDFGIFRGPKPTKKHQESHKNRSLKIDAKNHRKIRDFWSKMGAQIDPKIDAKIDAKKR